MAADRATEAPFDVCNVLDVIDVSVGKQKKFQIDIPQPDPITRALGCIEQNPALGRRSKIAIGFKKAAAECLVRHPIFILAASVHPGHTVIGNLPMLW